jgi:hypothetical protein
MSNFMKIHAARADFHPDRRRDGLLAKLIIAFRNFANVSKIVINILFAMHTQN